MPVVRPYPIGEVSPQPIPNVAPSVPTAGDINLFGGNQARDLQAAGQNLDRTSDSLFTIYERKAKDANDNGVQDLNNRYITGKREILRTGPDAYYGQKGADAINGAAATTDRLTKLKDQLLGQAPNDDQRQKLRPILDAHLAESADGIARHADTQRAVYGQTVASTAIETSQADAAANPANLGNAMARAEDAARFLSRGQALEVVETEVRKAGGSVVSVAIGTLLARNDPRGVTLFQQHGDRLDRRDRRTLGAAAETLSNTVAAAAWLRDRSAVLRTPAPTVDAALDAVNTASGSTAEPPPVVSSNGMLLDQDNGIAGTRARLGEIEARRRALTALNQQEFAANPARLRANQAAIDADTAQSRAAVKAETDRLYADLRRHLTTGGPNGGPAVTPPPATIMSRLTDAQQDAVTAQVNSAIEDRKTRTDPQTFYAIHQGLTAADAGERQRWASTNLVPFMGRLSGEDLAALEKLQTALRSSDNGPEQRRLQAITRIANDALRSTGIDPTPRLDASPDSDAAQAAMFHRVVQDELSAFEIRGGRKSTEAEAYEIVNSLKERGIEHGWLKDGNRKDSLIKAANGPSDGALNKDGMPLSDAGPPPAGQDRLMVIDVPTDPGSYKRFLDEHRRTENSPRSTARGASMAVPLASEWLPGSAVLGKLTDAVSQAARKFAARLGGAAAAAGSVTAGVAAEAAIGALALIVIPTNSQAEYEPIGENLRVRIFTDQRSATVEQRVDDGLFGTGIGAKWVGLPVGAAWGYDKGRRYVAIDRSGLEQAIGREAADAALGGNGIAEARRPSDEGGGRRRKDGYEEGKGDDERQEALEKEAKLRNRRENKPPRAEDLERRPDQPHVPPHERSDKDIDEVAHKIVSGHAWDKHRQEFPEIGSDTELQAHVADVIRKARRPADADPAEEPETESKKLRGGRTAYRHKATGTTIVDDPLGEGTVARPKGRRFFDNMSD